MSTINVYCDESCHLENDRAKTMVIGALWAESEAGREASRRLLEIKKRHGLRSTFDLKWVAVSPSKLAYFHDVVDYFFDNSALHFRAVVIEKDELDHSAHNQSHDEWYYKMFFLLLRNILSRKHEYRVYIDIKDSCSASRVAKLHQVINNSMFDFDSAIVSRVQQVRSHEVQLLQVADLLMGAVGYVNRGLSSSSAKLAVATRIRERSGFRLTRSTLPSEQKFNVFCWHPRDSGF